LGEGPGTARDDLPVDSPWGTAEDTSGIPACWDPGHTPGLLTSRSAPGPSRWSAPTGPRSRRPGTSHVASSARRARISRPEWAGRQRSDKASLACDVGDGCPLRGGPRPAGHAPRWGRTWNPGWRMG